VRVAVPLTAALAVARGLVVAVGNGAEPLRVAGTVGLGRVVAAAAVVGDSAAGAVVATTGAVVAVCSVEVLHAVSRSPSASSTTIACFLTSLFLLNIAFGATVPRSSAHVDHD
jgi:hypothetical protein